MNNMNNNNNQIETIYELKTDVALLKQCITTMDKEFISIKSQQKTNTILLVTSLTGIIGILLDSIFN